MWIYVQLCLLAITVQTTCQAGKAMDMECYDKVSDVVFVLDSSFSVSRDSFTIQLNFVSKLVDTFAIDPYSVKVAVMTFGTDLRPDFHLNQYQTKKDVQHAVEQIGYLEGKQGTYTGDALEYARTVMFKTEHGGRKESGKIIILITDGHSNNNTQTLWEASMAHSYDIEVFAIGVGAGTDRRELRGIGSEPKDNHVFNVDSYEALPSIQKALEHMVCERPSNDQQVTPTAPSIKSSCGGKPADVFFIVDSSSSIWRPDFYKQLDFIKDVISFFDLGEKKTRVGVIAFSDGIHPTIPLSGSYDRHALEGMIDKVPYTAGGTNTGGAIRYLTNHAFAEDVARPHVAHVAILMTDGQSRNMTQTVQESRRAHKKGIYLFAIGIGQGTDRRELTDIASDPDKDFMFRVDDYQALNSIKDLLAIKACEVPDHFQKDQPVKPVLESTCQFKRETDVMFLFDSGAIGRHHTHMVEQLIGDCVRDMDTFDVIRAGILRESCPRGSDASLSQFVNAQSFRRHMKKPGYKGLQPILHRLRRYSFKPQYGGRMSSDKVAVLFLDDKLENSKATIQEARRAKFLKIRIIVVAIGHHYDEKQLKLLASVPTQDNIVHVDGFKSLYGIKGRLLDLMCKGRLYDDTMFPSVRR